MLGLPRTVNQTGILFLHLQLRSQYEKEIFRRRSLTYLFALPGAHLNRERALGVPRRVRPIPLWLHGRRKRVRIRERSEEQWDQDEHDDTLVGVDVEPLRRLQPAQWC